MAPRVDIKFQNNQTLYFPGQVVNGKVILTTDKIRVINVVKLKVKGFSYVSLAPRGTKNRNRRASEKETFYNIKRNIFGDGITSQTFGVGVHSFNFTFTLPTGIPSSFESSVGYIRHTCKAAIVIESKIFDAKFTARFSVGADYDLNNDAAAKAPIMMSKEKALGLFWCEDGKLSFNLNVDHAGYVPGENIVINAQCSNESSNSTNYTEAKVVQTVMYSAAGRTKKTKKVICSLKHRSINPGRHDNWSGELLKIPPVPPSKLPGCSLIKIVYKLKFKISSVGMFTPLSQSAEIIIGAIPLRQVFNMLAVGSPTSAPRIIERNVDDIASAPNIESIVSPIAPSAENDAPPPYPWADLYPELPPPSYAECVMSSRRPSDSEGSDSDAAEGERKGPSGPFVPQYVSYGWL